MSKRESITELLEMFLSMKSKNTRRAYGTAIADFEHQCGKLVSVTAPQAMRYFAALKIRTAPDGDAIAGATLRQRYAALNSIYNYLVDMGALKVNPLRPVARAISWRQMAQKRPTALLPFSSVRRLLRLPMANTKEGIRDRAILALLFGAGLRRSEALGLAIGDIKISPWGIMYLDLLHTKGGKRQVRGIAKFAWKYLSTFISQRKTEGAQNGDALFVFYYQTGAIRGAMSEATLYRVFRGYCKQIGIRAAPHAARTTFGTALHERTHSDLLVARALGHSGTVQVGRYVKQREEIELNEITALEYK